MHRLNDGARGLSVDSGTTHAARQSQTHFLKTKHGKVTPVRVAQSWLRAALGLAPWATRPPTYSASKRHSPEVTSEPEPVTQGPK